MSGGRQTEIELLLRSIDRRLANLLEELAGNGARTGTRRKALSAADRRALEAIVPVVAARQLPRTVFFARDAMELLSPLPGVLEQAFGTRKVNVATTKRLGKLLARAAACKAEILGHVVERDEKSGAAFWSFRRV